MPKKSKGQNAFYYFMLDWRQREERSGRKFANLREVQADPRCSDEWKSLSALQKKDYESMAKKYKTGDVKHTNVGESLSVVQKEQREEAEFKENMQIYVTTTINRGLSNNALNGTKFYLVHCNWFYIVHQKEPKYVPAEFAIGEFSLQNGIERYNHKLVHVKPELGFAWDSISNSRNYHKIPIELPEGEDSFYDMYMDLIKFLEPAKIEGRYPPFFTTKKLYSPVQSLFKQLATAADAENIFNVYSVELLFTKLHKIALTRSVTDENDDVLDSGMLDAVGEAEFLKEKFAFAKNIECEYHKNLDGTSQYCSLSIIRQWAFTICDYCCESFDIKRIPGVHCPEREFEDDLASNIATMSLNTTRSNNLLSMTGVSDSHRLKVSERTHKEEQIRRKENKELHIIDYSANNENESAASSSVAYERPLRPPTTKSFAVAAASSKQADLPDFCDMNFPSIGGRGVMLKKKPNSTKQSLGRGHGSC